MYFCVFANMTALLFLVLIRAMLMNVFPQSVVLELDEYAEALSVCTIAFQQGA